MCLLFFSPVCCANLNGRDTDGAASSTVACIVSIDRTNQKETMPIDRFSSQQAQVQCRTASNCQSRPAVLHLFVCTLLASKPNVVCVRRQSCSPADHGTGIAFPSATSEHDMCLSTSPTASCDAHHRRSARLRRPCMPWNWRKSMQPSCRRLST